MCLGFRIWDGTELPDWVDLFKSLVMWFGERCNIRSFKLVFSFIISFAIIYAICFLLRRLDVNQLREDPLDEEEEAECESQLEIKPYVPNVNEPVEVSGISLNFLPDVSDLQVRDDDGGEMKFLTEVKRHRPEIEEVNEPEALIATQMAIKMKNQEKHEKAHKLFQHAMALHSTHPDILNHYGEFLEEQQKDYIKADHLYTKALIVCPEHSKALVNQKRTLPVVDKLDEKQLKRIDKKRDRLIKIPHNDPALKRMKKEAYFQHIHHTVAIEGNTMSLAETRVVVETRMAVPGKSLIEHNEIIGLDAALRFINNTLVNKDSYITVEDILQMHKRVLGNVDPIEAGSLRQTQVFIGEHTPPAPRHLGILMEEFVEWFRSDGVMKLHPVKQAALAHYKLVHIHPFLDGNGRTARLLMNLILMRAGYPPVIIRKQDRALYYEYLRIADEGDVRPFVRFIAQCTEGTLDVYLYTTQYGVDSVKELALESSDPEQSCDIVTSEENQNIIDV